MPRGARVARVAGGARAGSVAGAAGLAEAQRIEHGDRPGADREDVTQDAADAGGGALEGLDSAGVVVGLDLERAHDAAADVDRSGVLAGAHDDVLALGGQRAQQLLGVLVGAVLAPQQRVHRQLHLVRRAPLLDAHELVLGAREAERERVLDGGQAGFWATGRRRVSSRSASPSSYGTSSSSPGARRAASAAEAAHTRLPSTAMRIDWKIFRPSAEPPVSSSTACSGWGIRPKTLPRSLQTPAMSWTEPLKFSPGA